MNNVMTAETLFCFDVPDAHDGHTREEISHELCLIAMCAVYLSDGNRDLIAELECEAGAPMDEYFTAGNYFKAIYELHDIINGYNFDITDYGLSEPVLKIEEDEQKNELLGICGDFKIYRVVGAK